MKFGEVGRTIRLGIIGFGWRGYGQTETLLEMPDVEICAVCDVYPDRVELGKEMVKKARGKDCFGTTDYREVNRMEGDDDLSQLLFQVFRLVDPKGFPQNRSLIFDLVSTNRYLIPF